MLQISNLSFSYSQKDIFSQINLTISTPQIIAIIGDNGSGKTTLLKLLAGQLQPDDGKIRISGTVGYLAQSYDELANKPNSIKNHHPSNNKPNHRSGGEQTKLALEQLFAQSYDVLLLDEPTNNLDTSVRQWLLTRLKSFRGLILLVSHDRDFIDQVANQILEVKAGQIQLYDGNYSTYITRQNQLHDLQMTNYQKAQQTKTALKHRIQVARRKNNEVSTRRFNKNRDESKLAFHGRRNHAQNTAGKAINAAESKLAQLGQINKPYERKTYAAELSADFLRRRRLLKVSELSKSYPHKPLFQNLSFEIYTSERWRITGNNGSGKTTLLKILLGSDPADSGEVKLAPQLSSGYISQDMTGLDLERSFLAQTAASPTEVFQAGATMDLGRADLQQTCRNLSRGQLTKLAFLKILIQPVDLLILDEPTNHLDIRARENIEQALTNYAGAILLVTHDQRFAQNLQIEQEINL